MVRVQMQEDLTAKMRSYPFQETEIRHIYSRMLQLVEKYGAGLPDGTACVLVRESPSNPLLLFKDPDGVLELESSEKFYHTALPDRADFAPGEIVKVQSLLDEIEELLANADQDQVIEASMTVMDAYQGAEEMEKEERRRILAERN